MKKNLMFIAIILTAVLCFNCEKLTAQSAALIYMQNMDSQFKNIMADTWDYTCTVAHGKKAKKSENKRKELLKTIKEAKEKISKMADFEGDGSLRDTVVSFLELQYNVINKDYAKIVDMEEVAEQSYDMMEAYLLAQELANTKLDTASSVMVAQQNIFAKAHNINIIDGKDKIAKKLESSGKVISYYNIIYLIFFKSYKQEAYLMDAIIKNDVNGIEQNKNALIASSVAGIAALDTIKSFKGDASLKTTTKAVLTFYKGEASGNLQTIIDFYIGKDNFDKIKAAFDAKSESSRTKADVEQFNKAVADYNKSITKFNTTSQQLDSKRNLVIDNWNNAVTVFMDKHIPKYK